MFPSILTRSLANVAAIWSANSSFPVTVNSIPLAVTLAFANPPSYGKSTLIG
jgi:hypothetical protein